MDNQLRKIRVVDGTLVDPFYPKPSDIIPANFMHSISMLPRFTGNSAWPYTIGQHTLNLIKVVPAHLRRAALIHDWAEAWFNDVASPVKANCPAYRAAEHGASDFIACVMGVSKTELLEFGTYDKRIYVNERDVLFKGVISERGRGDDLRPLPGLHVQDFYERHWTYTRDKLHIQFTELFPNDDAYVGRSTCTT